MLRVSEFCRGPLSPVPSSRSRRRRRPSFENSIDGDGGGGGDNDNDDNQEEGSVVSITNNNLDRFDMPSISSDIKTFQYEDEEFDNGEEEISCLVRLRTRNAASSKSLSSPVLSSSSVRIPLDLLKNLLLQDGDYAYLEKHRSVETSDARTTDNTNAMLQKVVVRLELMDEEEEEEEEDESSSPLMPYDSNINCKTVCSVPPIVLANLGISPQVLWQQNTKSSLVLSEQGVVFRLRAIHDNNEDGDSSSSSSSSSDAASSWQVGKGKISNVVPAVAQSLQRRRRKQIAGRVLLRPLGRAALWPWFSITPPPPPPLPLPLPLQDDSKKPEDPSKEPESNQTTPSVAAVAPTVTDLKRDDNGADDNDNEAWIYPSRSGIVLQESTLCEVRPNSNNDNNLNSFKDISRQIQNVCYYEVLKIEETNVNTVDPNKEEDEDERKDVEDDNDEHFYVTAPCTQFELDSRPLSTLSHVRRLPLPPYFLCQASTEATTGDSGSHDGCATVADENKIQVPREQQNDPLVTPRKLFASSEITTRDGNILSKDEDTTSDEIAFSCHPDWKEVASALLDAPPIDVGHLDDEEGTNGSLGRAAASSADSRILHLVGTDGDHDLQACVTTAASMVGMQCLSIQGLAAFGYEHRRSSKNAASPSRGSVTVRSAMIEQQLAGIDAALEYIETRRMEPCVLHLSGVDEELASVAADDQFRCQIEDRFWSKWKEVLATVSISVQSGRRRLGRRVCSNDNDDRLDYRYTPRILIVISTKTPLKKGPWLDHLIFPSITLSLPNDNYIHFLWNASAITVNDDDDEISNKIDKQSSVLLSPEMMPLLRGRPAREIFQLQQRISTERTGGVGGMGFDNSNSSNNTQNDGDQPIDESFRTLEKLCKNFDAGRRTASSDVARISSVSWEDVGGLDHVRAEILDAIELPLKHPHLFPPNTGRSGILLFGPPGTGKTLVAKAVATECGLPFLSVKGPELLGSYIGESEANIRKVFSSARLAAENNLPVRASILFFDELDSLAPKRGGTSNHGGGVMERVVASLLAELDGGGSRKENSGRVFVLGATNRPDLLDPSLLRPGRLDRLVYLGIPTSNQERTRVLVSQLRKMKLKGDAFEMASTVIEEGLPPRLSGADMSKLSSGAMLQAIRRLCRQADREREELRILSEQKQQGGEDSAQRRVVVPTIDEILESWGEDKCTPVITLDDLRLAAKDVSPSVSEEEIHRYERLRADHETSSNRTIPPS